MESLQADTKVIEDQAEREVYEGLSDFLNAFSKGIKTSLIYPPDNPIPREFKKSCWNKLYQYLQEFGRIDFEVHASSFMLNGETIHEVNTREGNLPHVLHRDGIRRLLFKEAINQTEWEQFFDDILTVMRAGEDYEDLVNLFWQRDFTSIEYDVVEDFSLAEIEDEFTPPQEQQLEYSEIIESESEIESRNALDILLDSSGKELEGLSQDDDFLDMFRNIQVFSPAERNYLEDLMAADGELIIEFESIDLLFDIFLAENELENFDESLLTLDNMFDKMLESEQFSVLVYLIKGMKQCYAELQNKPGPRADKFKDSLARVGDRIRISRITNLLNSSEWQDFDGIRLYLEELEWKSMPSLIWMLGELNNFPARKMVIEALINKGRDRIDIIGNAIHDSRWYVVRNAVLILGEIGNKKGLSYMSKALEHFDERVRWEAVVAVEKLASKPDLKILIPYLKDESERIRHKVIEIFSQNRFSPAFEGLQAIVKSSQFNGMGFEEQKNLLKAIAYTGKEAALPVLKKIIKKRSLFSSGASQKKKEAAILATSLIEAEEAWKVIEEAARKKKGPMANLAQLILEKKGRVVPEASTEEDR
ncbi:MAG: HEAT repeat domain-containing protein [candidate division Zixibacteria bacterium]|jgi:hypothetical protein|nr:HEAT repeat domain-containing protein [candidate division Zixibacteria bacterium]NIR62877.1 HEAT repeat domain-containing protein [candidate division Zixibacteria bacterium]NIS15985.1 HEAT repeat domain-containing protein [candidate division Zixibacteria bacterium]NIS44892.1 HEAT repeat domain-containing protein [candidate division Zixibacteria bacterium]NIT52394.1 HEAT repeat domain-containing protein [candidate division Zixibacteria bacterium]